MRFVIEEDILTSQQEIIDWSQQQLAAMAAPWKLEIADSFIEWYSDTSYVELQTSGSTGTPKLIKHSKSSMLASAHKTGMRFGLEKGMTSLNCLPAKYIAGKMMLIRAMELDMIQYCVAPKLAVDIPVETLIDFCAMTPMQLSRTLEASVDRLADIKTLILGGGPISPTLRHQIKQLETDCFATYGMTETITHIATMRLNGDHAAASFRALEGVTFSTYEDRLIITADHLDKDEILTTDIVELHDAHHFQWLGRADDVINRGGVKLHPARIEAKLHPWINEPFFITKADDAQSGEAPVLVIESEAYGAQPLGTLEKAMAILDKLERPRNIYFVPQFVRTETGKIKRDITLYRS